jgi:hypothetical protein
MHKFLYFLTIMLNDKYYIAILAIILPCYYYTQTYINNIDIHIIDHVQDMLPDISKYDNIPNMFIAGSFAHLYYTLNSTKKLYLFKDFAKIFILVLFLRLISSSMTIYPSLKDNEHKVHKKCTNTFNISGGCNDFMFSGHTAFLTLSSLFVMYAKGKVDIISIVYSLLGCMSIISAKNHYSVDVFMGFLISAMMFAIHFLCKANRACSKY